MSSKLVLLHTNDLHGQVDGIARIATLVEKARATGSALLWLDGGDVEDREVWLSSATKGTAMHRVLAAAGCNASVAGNASWYAYGPAMLAAHARAAAYPLLVGNLRSLDGRQIRGTGSTAILRAGSWHIGVVGITDPMPYTPPELLGLTAREPVRLVRRLALDLRRRGADLVVLLSHFAVPENRRFAESLDGVVDVIVGAHDHELLPEGERIGGVLLVEAGSHARHLGRIDAGSARLTAQVEAVTEDVPRHERVLRELAAVESELESFLDEPIGRLEHRLDADGATQWAAEVIRQRLGADIGFLTPAAGCREGLPAGEIRRRDLWSACRSSAKQARLVLRGAQIQDLVERGTDEQFAALTANGLRGQPRGVLQVAGDVDRLHPDREYVVATTSWEVGPNAGLIAIDWTAEPVIDFFTMMRETLEAHLLQAS